MHLDVCKLFVYWYVWIGLNPWCNFFFMSHGHGFPMHTYFLFNILVIFEFLRTFLIAFLSLPLFLFTLVMSMAPKHKSTLAQNPLHSGASSSSNSTPLSLWFNYDDAHKAFSDNFSRRGVHSECQVILVDFTNTGLPTIIHNRHPVICSSFLPLSRRSYAIFLFLFPLSTIFLSCVP